MSKSIISHELRQQVEAKLSQCIQQANQAFKHHFSIPEVSYKLRGKAAGKAYLQLNEIRLNPKLFVDNQRAFIDEVIPHEVAHLIVHQVYGRVRPHGQEWQALMAQVFNVAPNTTHTFDVSKVSKSFEYRCGCNTYPLTVRRHNKVLRSETSYRCSQCLQLLTFTGKQLS